MIKSKLFNVLKKFSKKEMTKFGEYVNSPYFNKNKNVRNLFKIYKRFYPGFDGNNFTKEYVFERLYPERKYADEILRNLNSDLLELAEGFLAHQNVNKYPVVLKKHLLKELNNRNIFSLFEKNYSSSKEYLNKQKTRNSWYYHNYYILHSDKSLYNSLQGDYSKEDLKETEESLIRFFLIRLLEIYSYVINKKRLFPNIEFEFSFLDKIVEILKKYNFDDTPAIQIHYNKLMLFLTNEADYYYKVKYLLEKYGDLLGKEQQYNTYISLNNYLKKYQPGGEAKAISESFNIRKRIIENNLFLSENRISNTFFRNQVKAGLMLKEFDWVYDFISNYNKRLSSDFRKSTVNYCLASYYYEKSELTKALKYLSNVEYKNYHYILDIKSLQTQIYWEQGDIILLKYFLDSYRHYIESNRAKIKRSNILTHRSLIKFVIKMISLQMNYDHEKLLELKTNVRSENNLIKKEWLLLKIDDLIYKKQTQIVVNRSQEDLQDV